MPDPELDVYDVDALYQPAQVFWYVVTEPADSNSRAATVGTGVRANVGHLCIDT